MKLPLEEGRFEGVKEEERLTNSRPLQFREASAHGKAESNTPLDEGNIGRAAIPSQSLLSRKVEDTEDHEAGTKMSSRYNPQSSVAVPRSLSAITAHPSPFCDWLKPSHLGQPLPVAIPYLDTWSHHQPAGHHTTGSSSTYISQPESPTSVNRVSDTARGQSYHIILGGDTYEVVTNATRKATNLVKDSSSSRNFYTLLSLLLSSFQ